MQTITLLAIPNQKLQFTGDGQQYSITIKAAGDHMYMDVSINGVLVASGKKCQSDALIMYTYEEGLGGNFAWATTSGNDPFYTAFNAGDTLLYLTNAELVAARA